MSSITDFLERMGQDARLRHASRSEVELALAGTNIDPALRTALLDQDEAWLELLLAPANICCMINPGEDDEEEEKEGGDEDDDEGNDDEDPSRADWQK